jgi:hypothetical protein
MSTSNPSLVQSHKPASFTERGVAVPFTTPQLAGARIRRAERTGTEFIVPNPSGGRGVYILHWGAVRQLCRPTVHDTLLHQRISRLPSMDPSSVRLAARQLAAEGMAGREATLAAGASVEADRKELILVNFLMLIILMEQVEPTGLGVSTEIIRTPELDQRARRIVAQVATSIGRTAVQIGTDLEALSALFVPVGLDGDLPAARLPALTARLDATARGLANWARQFPDDGHADAAISLSRTASVTANAATATLRAARDLTLDIRGLLQAWAGTPAEIAQQTHHAEWILDGWERFSLLWETATHASAQRALVPELAQLVPTLPRDGAGRGSERQEPDKPETSRGTPLNTNWRAGGASHALIARNERLHALIT